MFQIE